MSACPFGECDGSGYVRTCVEPMAGLAGYEQTPCRCFDRSPAVSPLEVAWADRDRLRAAAEEAQDDYMRAECHARAMGPRPAKVPT